jgi:hypothetical protein
MNAFINQGCLIYILDVTVVKDGWCDEETEMREQVKNIVMAVVSHFINEYRKELIAEGASEGFLEVLLQLGENPWEEKQSGGNKDDNDNDDDNQGNDSSDDNEEDTDDDK